MKKYFLVTPTFFFFIQASMIGNNTSLLWDLYVHTLLNGGPLFTITRDYRTLTL